MENVIPLRGNEPKEPADLAPTADDAVAQAKQSIPIDSPVAGKLKQIDATVPGTEAEILARIPKGQPVPERHLKVVPPVDSSTS